MNKAQWMALGASEDVAEALDASDANDGARAARAMQRVIMAQIQEKLDAEFRGRATLLSVEPFTEALKASDQLVDAICDKDQDGLSPSHTHSDILGTVYGGEQGDY